MTMKTAPLDAAIADRLLDLLSTDDLFRERFQRDHLAALRSIGYDSPTPGQMTACGLVAQAQLEPFRDCRVHELASKDAILGARLPEDEKRARLAELAIDQVAVLDVRAPDTLHFYLTITPEGHSPKRLDFVREFHPR